MLLRIIAVFMAFGSFAAPAHAQTTTFVEDVFTSFRVARVNNLVGDTPATALFRVGSGAVVQFGQDITNNTTLININSVRAPTTYLWYRFGRVENGVFSNANGVGLTNPGGATTRNVYTLLTAPGSVSVNTAPFTDSCNALGGCNALLFGASTFSANGGGFTASSVGTVTAPNPEPHIWALMILGFIGIGWRAKAARHHIVSDVDQPISARTTYNPA